MPGAVIRAWQDVYNAHDDNDGPFLDHDAFAAEGRAIAQAVKAQLPDWIVVYFDESQMGGGRPRFAYEYEITQSPPGPDPA